MWTLISIILLSSAVALIPYSYVLGGITGIAAFFCCGIAFDSPEDFESFMGIMIFAMIAVTLLKVFGI